MCFFLYVNRVPFVFSLAPDYILCSKKMEIRIVPEIIKAWQSFYTENALNSDSFCHIVNQRHFERVRKLIDPNKVAYGGQTDANENYISPTIMYVYSIRNKNKIFSIFFSL